MQDEITTPQPKTLRGFISGFGISAGLLAVGEYFEHQMQNGGSYAERLSALAKKPGVWGATLVAGLVGTVLADRNAKIEEAKAKNLALFNLVEEKDAALHLQFDADVPRGQSFATETAIMPPESKYTARIKQPLPQHAVSAKRVDYVDGNPPSMER